MPKVKSLLKYKISYDPDAKRKTKSVEVESNGVTRTFAVPIVSGDRGIEFQINEQLPIFSNYQPKLTTTDKQNSTSLPNISQIRSSQLGKMKSAPISPQISAPVQVFAERF